MPDVFTKKKRSEVMSRIRSRGNKDTELAIMRVFREHGHTGWRRHLSLSLRGAGVRCQRSEVRSQRSSGTVRPDFVFRELRVAVFVDGCFWHGCSEHCRMPEGNSAFWKAKIMRNMKRDGEVTRALRRAGWRVLRVWEHELSRKNGRRLLARLRRVLQ